MFTSNLVVHCPVVKVVILVIITLIVALNVYSPISMKLGHRFIGSSKLPKDDRFYGDKTADNYFNRRYFDLESYSVSRGNSGLTSPNRVPVKIYTKGDVVKCFDFLSSSPHKGHYQPKKKMHFAFIGDSIIRQHFVNFLRWIPDYDRITTARKNNASSFTTEEYFKEDRNVTSILLNHLRVSYNWRIFIEDVLADFLTWLSASNQDNEMSPDFILLGITAHHIIRKRETDSLEMYVKLLEHKLLPLIKKSQAANPKQKIVWLHQSRTVLQMTPEFYRIHPDDISKYNKEIRRLFEGTGIIIWDSINSIVEEGTRACTLSEFERSDRKGYSKCYDFIHPGLATVTLGTHLIFGHLCEAIDIY